MYTQVIHLLLHETANMYEPELNYTATYPSMYIGKRCIQARWINPASSAVSCQHLYDVLLATSRSVTRSELNDSKKPSIDQQQLCHLSQQTGSFLLNSTVYSAQTQLADGLWCRLTAAAVGTATAATSSGAVYMKIHAIFTQLGFAEAAAHVDLPDQAALCGVEQYFALQQGVVWQNMADQFTAEGFDPTEEDQLRIKEGIKQAAYIRQSVQEKQQALMQEYADQLMQAELHFVRCAVSLHNSDYFPTPNACEVLACNGRQGSSHERQCCIKCILTWLMQICVDWLFKAWLAYLLACSKAV